MTEIDGLLSNIGKLTADNHLELIEKLYALDHMKAYKDIQSKYILEFVAEYGPVTVDSYLLLGDSGDSAMISIAARPIFTQIANSLVDAFCKRAVEVYGERG